MAKPGVKYGGLHKKDSYEGLIDYLENKQEKVKYPDREAKFVRDSPQYQSLLNEGFVEVEEQQLKQIKEEQAEHAVIRTATDTNETAKEVRVVAKETKKPILTKNKISGTTYASKLTSSSESQTGSPARPAQLFEMDLDDRFEDCVDDVKSVEDTQRQDKEQQTLKITKALQNQLATEVTPNATLNFGHKMAMDTIKNLGNMTVSAFRELSSSSSQEPKYTPVIYSNDPPALSITDKPKFAPFVFNPVVNVETGLDEAMPQGKEQVPKTVTKNKKLAIKDSKKKAKPTEKPATKEKAKPTEPPPPFDSNKKAKTTEPYPRVDLGQYVLPKPPAPAPAPKPPAPAPAPKPAVKEPSVRPGPYTLPPSAKA